MSITPEKFIKNLKNSPENSSFSELITLIEENYIFTPTAFQNGELLNEAGQNSGSCKLFSFAKLQGFTKEETLHCFGDYYRIDVLGNAQGNDHQNIRNFMKFGWDGIKFTQEALSLK